MIDLKDIVFIDRNNEVHSGREIAGYENYLITDDGRIWNRKTKRFLKPYDAGYGYLKISLWDNKNRRQAFVHRLVAEAYIENPLGLETVDHIDGDKSHNNVQNLQWMTREDNVRKAKNKAVYQFNLAGNLIRVWPSVIEASRETDINPTCISACALGKQKSAGNYIWRYDAESEASEL